MADEDEESSRPAIPAWQNAQSEPSAPSPPVEVQATSSSSDSISSSRDKEDEGEGEYTTAEDTSNEDTRFKDTADEVKAEVKAETEKESEHSEDEDNLTVARRFLSDPSVQSSSLASKLKFLRDKGLSESTIQTLLPAATVQEQEDKPQSTPSEPRSQPPIITYPEFLQSSSSDSPPLVTSTALLTVLQATALISAAIYGTSQLYLHPLLSRLNDSRSDFHSSVASNLSSIISKLESSVSELPPPPSGSTSHKRDLDSDSDVDDPSELFHRDVGTQTTLEPAPILATPAEKSAAESQAGQLSTLAATLSSLRDDITSQSDSLGDVKTLIDVFRDDLDVLTYRNAYSDATGYNYMSRMSTSSTSAANQGADQKDEVEKARNSIRRIKGVLLSSRSFPASTR